MALPAITAGITRGIPAIMGEAVIRKEVMGAIMERIIPIPSPKLKVAMIRIRLTNGPVMYTERFLKN